jgi:hypothetical protein
MGEVATPPCRISKCRWQPVDSPALPTAPICWPAWTVCPVRTITPYEYMWPYTLVTPPPWFGELHGAGRYSVDRSAAARTEVVARVQPPVAENRMQAHAVRLV